MPITIFGIKNCDTMKKARAWLDARNVAHEFHDYKTAGIDGARLELGHRALFALSTRGPLQRCETRSNYHKEIGPC